MGQTYPQESLANPSEPQINKSISTLFDNEEEQFNPANISTPIHQIIRSICLQIPIEIIESQIKVSIPMLKILYHDRFKITLSKLVSLLIEKLQELAKKSFILIQKYEWMFMLNIICFILLFTNEKIIKTVQNFITDQSQLSKEAKNAIQDIKSNRKNFLTNDLIDKLSFNQTQHLCSNLYAILILMIKQRIRPITSSSNTLQLIEQVEIAAFMLLMKMFLTPNYHKAIVEKGRNSVLLKDLMKIGEYFLAKGCNLCLGSVYESAMNLLLCLIKENRKNLKIIESQVKGLPIHLFKNLPVINHKNIYDFISIVILFSLCSVRIGTICNQRFNFNRLLALKLLHLLVKEIKITSRQITEMLEQLSLQMKVGAIQRAFVTVIVKNYFQLIDEKISEDRKIAALKKGNFFIPSAISNFSNKIISRITSRPPANSQEIKSNFSPYCRQSCHSQVLKKYLQSGTQPFNVKFKGKKYVIDYIDVILQLEKEDVIVQEQINQILEKLVYQFILRKKVLYYHNDRFVWNQILPSIITQKGLVGEEIRECEISLNSSDNNKSEIRSSLVGFAPVISQIVISKNEESLSSVSRASQNSRIKQLRHETQAQLVNIQGVQYQKTEELIMENDAKQFQSNRSLSKNRTIQNQLIFVKQKKELEIESNYFAQDSKNEFFLSNKDKANIIFHQDDIQQQINQSSDN